MKKLFLSLLLIIPLIITSYAQEDDPTVRRAIYMIRKGECDYALKALDMSLQKYGESELIHLYKGDAYACLNMNEFAIDEYNKAIELNGNYAKAYFSRGKLYIAEENKETGCSDLKKAFDIGYDNDKEFFMQECPDLAEDYIIASYVVHKFESDAYTVYFPKPFEHEMKDEEDLKTITAYIEQSDENYITVCWEDKANNLFNNPDYSIDDVMKDMSLLMLEQMYPEGKSTFNAMSFHESNGFDINYSNEDTNAEAKVFIKDSKLFFLCYAVKNKEINKKVVEVFYKSFEMK